MSESIRPNKNAKEIEKTKEIAKWLKKASKAQTDSARFNDPIGKEESFERLQIAKEKLGDLGIKNVKTIVSRWRSWNIARVQNKPGRLKLHAKKLTNEHNVPMKHMHHVRL
jgi:hypothetical protein